MSGGTAHSLCRQKKLVVKKKRNTLVYMMHELHKWFLDHGRHSQWGLYCPQVSKNWFLRAKNILNFTKPYIPGKFNLFLQSPVPQFHFSCWVFLALLRAAASEFMESTHCVQDQGYKIRANYAAAIEGLWSIAYPQGCNLRGRHLCLLVSGYWLDLWMVYILFLSAFVCDLNFENQGNL